MDQPAEHWNTEPADPGSNPAESRYFFILLSREPNLESLRLFEGMLVIASSDFLACFFP